MCKFSEAGKLFSADCARASGFRQRLGVNRGKFLRKPSKVPRPLPGVGEELAAYPGVFDALATFRDSYGVGLGDFRSLPHIIDGCRLLLGSHADQAAASFRQFYGLAPFPPGEIVRSIGIFGVALTPVGVTDGSQGVEDPWKEGQASLDPG